MTGLRFQTCCAMLLCLVVAGCLLSAVAQQSTLPGSASVVVPPFVRYSGILKDLNGNPLTGVVGVTFSLYKDSQSSVPVWTEVQNVYPDNTGRYSVILGTEKSAGLPTDIFISGEGRWLSVKAEGQQEQSRVLLLSVPYALKAADAETLGGKPASAYLLNQQAAEAAPASAHDAPAVASRTSTDRNAVTATITGGGTTNYVPLWTSSSNLGNSIVYQSTAGLGIGTTSPKATLDIEKVTGVRAVTSGNGTAIYGNATVASGTGKGVEGDSSSTIGTGVAGNANATTGSTQGVWGQSVSTSGTGVYGKASATSGKTIGVEGISASSSGTAGVFNNTGGGKVLSAQTNGTEVFSINGSGVTQVGTQGELTPTGMFNVTSTLTSYPAIVATGASDTDTANGSDGLDAFGGITQGRAGSGNAGTGVVGTGGLPYAIDSVGGNGVEGYGGGETGGMGVLGGAPGGDYIGGVGVIGAAGTGAAGLMGTGGAPSIPYFGGAGVLAYGSGNGGFADSDGDGIFATNPDGGTVSTGGYAGYFEGDINVTGTIFAGTKDFRIDHPTDPANKYLLHASVESSEMMNIYSGNATLDGSGEAIVQLPAWFEAVNGDFRYQLTSIGAPGPGLYIAQKISGSRFKIAGGSAGNEVSWQVTAVRHDAYAKANPLIVEQEKRARERGYYIHPELYGATRERGIARERYPEKMRTFKRKPRPEPPKLQPSKQAKAMSK